MQLSSVRFNGEAAARDVVRISTDVILGSPNQITGYQLQREFPGE